MGSRRESGRVLRDPLQLAQPFRLDGQAAGGEAVDPIEAALAEARERGYREGREQAAEELAGQIESSRRELAKALKRLAGLEARLARDHEARLLEVAIEAASRIVRRRIEADDPIALRALEEALDALPDAGSFRARLHPDDLRAVTESLRAEIEARRLELIADPEIGHGGTVVECDAGRVDATLEMAEAAVRAAIRGEDEPS